MSNYTPYTPIPRRDPYRRAGGNKYYTGGAARGTQEKSGEKKEQEAPDISAAATVAPSAHGLRNEGAARE